MNSAKLLEHAKSIKKEFDAKVSEQKPLKIIKKPSQKYNITTDLDTGYETQIYIIYRYKTLKNKPVHEFQRVLSPSRENKKLTEFLKKLSGTQFLLAFAEVKDNL